MSYCVRCGTKLAENDAICIGCGCPVNGNGATMQSSISYGAYKGGSKLWLWIVIGVVALLLGALAAFVLKPHDLKMSDFKETNSSISTILQYGVYDRTNYTDDGDPIYLYDNGITFYGITPKTLSVYPEEGRVVFFFPSDAGADVYKKINRYCDYEGGIGFVTYSYNDLLIRADSDCTYVMIEFN